MIGKVFSDTWLSLTDRSSYYTLLKVSPWYSLRVLLIIMVMLYLPYSVYAVFQVIPQVKKVVIEGSAELVARFPQDLVITWDQNTLSWQPDQVAEVPYPQVLLSEGEQSTQNLAVLVPDLVQQESANQNYESLIILSATQAAIPSMKIELSYSDPEIQMLPAFTLSAQTVKPVTQSFLEYLESQESTIIGSTIAGLFLSLILTKTLAFLTEAVFILVLARIFYAQYSSTQVWALLTRAYVLVLLLEYPFMYFDGAPKEAISLVFWIFILLGSHGLVPTRFFIPKK